ncbi:ABC transporter ATP-binding protein [Nocardiopsis sp. RSe5-2]|uniref:ABC transporter ATP-binding protein n=1 Tax=Nocardiopsis endophytica TaxID=3018445 RepID=A0ABT4U2D7_9ACTN|nr:ABC transporter ATP-binding protein [Nocardiopsis endophytica]MDA2811121.1 ABC transporter ATP-binding protein [Nocardiopsis endophytica]
MIRLDDVGWTYPHAGAPSLHGLDLQVRPGEFVVLCGASGSGKSTALRLMNGLVPHFHEEGTLTGTVTVDGADTRTARLDELGACTGTVMQHPRRQFFADTAPEEIAFAMENLGLPPDGIRARVADTLADLAGAVPIAQSLQRLSGGQQQQVAIAAATAHRPGIVLLDEPSANLSADAVDRLAATLARLKRDGVTVVVAEHRLRYLEDLADRIIVMRDGTVDTEWSAEAFRAVTDTDLAREGLRGHVSTAALSPLPATGASVAAPSPPDRLPAGALELEGIRCRLGGRTVIDLDRVVFPAGGVTAIRGANGAGKSTLARIVTGLQRSAGTVRLDGRPLSRRARQRASAIVMQDVQRQLFTDTVAAEIGLAGTDAPGTTGTTGPADTRAVLEALDLGHLAERHPLSLSGGQQQRLVVAAVRAAGRRVVVFDEPSSGVDRRHLRSVSDQIRRVAAGGAVVLLISHDEDLLALTADQGLTLTPPGATARRPGGGHAGDEVPR